MKSLLKNQSIVRALPTLDKETFGQVRLEPILYCEASSITLEFRIGSQQMYVLKDVFLFEEHIWGSKEYAYGKKLKFVHVVDAFDEQSKPIVNFVCNWVKNYGEAYVRNQFYNCQYQQYRGTGMEADGRKIRA